MISVAYWLKFWRLRFLKYLELISSWWFSPNTTTTKKKKKDSGNLFNFVSLLFSVSLLVSNRNSRFFPSLLILIVRRTMLKKNLKKELSSINPNRYLIRHQPVRHAVDDTRIWLIILSLWRWRHIISKSSTKNLSAVCVCDCWIKTQDANTIERRRW